MLNFELGKAVDPVGYWAGRNGGIISQQGRIVYGWGEEVKGRLMSRRWVIIFVLVLGLAVLLAAALSQTTVRDSDRVDAVLAAYEAGQFRVLRTRSVGLQASPDGDYVAAYSDGLYRLSDGIFWGQFDRVTFSPEGRYLVQPGDGIYRLSDLQRVVPVRSERILIGGGEHRVVTGNVVFSSDGEYVSISGAGRYRVEADSPSAEGYGVFRLSDGQQVVASDSFEIHFSPDSAYAATQDGVFRLSDGERLLQPTAPSDHIIPDFSPDGAYISASYTGVFRLSDGQKLFDMTIQATFSPDVQFAVLPDSGMYRLSDGQQLYALDHPAVYATLAHFSATGEYVAIPDEGLSPTAGTSQTFIYRVADGSLLFEIAGVNNYRFSPQGDLIAISDDGVYRLRDQQKLFDLQGEVMYWTSFSQDGTYVVARNDGIYRVADGQKLIDLEAASVTFSPDLQYVAIDDDGLYRLSDQHKIFDIQGRIRDFTPDGDFVQVGFLSNDPDLSIYRISDGRHFPHIQFALTWYGELSAVLQVGNTVLIPDATQHVQRVPFVYTEINRGERQALLDERAGEYLIGILGEERWIPADEATLFYLPE